MSINWWTLGLQAVNFLVLVWLLWRLLYRPIRDVIEKRRQRTEAAFAEAADAKKEAETARQHFEDETAKLDQERAQVLAKAREEMAGERQKLLADARREADAVQEAAGKTISEERETALADLRQEIAALAADLAGRILKQTGTSPAAAILPRLEQHLAELPASEVERLNGAMAGKGGGLTVVTANALTADQQKEWSNRLGALLKLPGAPEFTTDPNILGGAELRFPHAALNFTWADQLARAQVEVHDDKAAS